jgi:hypothetical protein
MFGTCVRVNLRKELVKIPWISYKYLQYGNLYDILYVCHMNYHNVNKSIMRKKNQIPPLKAPIDSLEYSSSYILK